MSTGVRVVSLTEYEAFIGGEDLKRFLDSFSCPINPEVENFLKRKAVSSSKLSASHTYLLSSDKTGELLGYYTLVLKSYSVNGAKLSSTNRRFISRFAEEDESGNFNAVVYLIAQIGKNFAVSKENQLAGSDLLTRALDEFRMVKSRVGGKLVMIECESDCPKLLDFYKATIEFPTKSVCSPVSIKEAISDLPEETLAEGAPYPMPPETDYQRLMRHCGNQCSFGRSVA